jgi:hypothetical protein
MKARHCVKTALMAAFQAAQRIAGNGGPTAQLHPLSNSTIGASAAVHVPEPAQLSTLPKAVR